MQKAHSRHLGTIIGIVIVGLLIGVIITLNGASLNMDSLWYMTYARSLQAGDGLSAPITTWQTNDLRVVIRQWPPLYPIMLAIGNNPLVTGRIISVLSLISAALLMYAIGLTVYDNNRRWALAGVGLFLTMYALLEYSFVWSITEVPFTPLCLAILWLMLQYPRRNPVPIGYTIAIAILLAAASMLRYVGVGIGFFVGFVMLYWVIRRKLSVWHLVVLSLSAFPLLGYILYLHSVTGSVTGLQTTADALNLRDIPDTLIAVYELISYPIHFVFSGMGLESNYWTLLIIVPFFLWVALLLWRKQKHLLVWDLLLPIFYIAGYQLTFWVLSVRSTHISGAEPRHYIVILPAIIVIMLYLVKQAQVSRWLWLPLALLWGISGLAAIPDLQSGRGYNTPFYRETITPIIQELYGELPDDTLYHTMHVAYLSILMDNDTPIRMVGISATLNTDFYCDDLIYPDGYGHAAFFAIDEPVNRNKTTDELLTDFADWAAPCGEIVDSRIADGFAMVLIRLDETVQDT